MPEQSTTALPSRRLPSGPKVPTPVVRPLKVYAIDPSAGNVVGNRMTVDVRWEPLQPGPAGSKVAVVDYDPVHGCYYTPVDLEDPGILIRGGLDPTESDPRFHQQMVYAVVMATVEKFEAALGRRIRWHRAERIAGADGVAKIVGAADDIWVLHLFPHAMLQAMAQGACQAIVPRACTIMPNPIRARRLSHCAGLLAIAESRATIQPAPVQPSASSAPANG